MDNPSYTSVGLAYEELKQVRVTDCQFVTKSPDGHVEKRVDAVSCGTFICTCAPVLSSTVLTGISMVALSTALDWK